MSAFPDNSPENGADTSKAPEGGDTIAAELEPLRRIHPAAHALLISRCRDGFFEHEQPKRSLNSLANQLLLALLDEEDGDARQ